MIQLIVTFLMSLGFHFNAGQVDAVSINQQNGENYGIVITDDVGTRSSMTLVYDKASNTFKVVQ